MQLDKLTDVSCKVIIDGVCSPTICSCVDLSLCSRRSVVGTVVQTLLDRIQLLSENGNSHFPIRKTKFGKKVYWDPNCGVANFEDQLMS